MSLYAWAVLWILVMYPSAPAVTVSEENTQEKTVNDSIQQVKTIQNMTVNPIFEFDKKSEPWQIINDGVMGACRPVVSPWKRTLLVSKGLFPWRTTVVLPRSVHSLGTAMSHLSRASCSVYGAMGSAIRCVYATQALSTVSVIKPISRPYPTSGLWYAFPSKRFSPYFEGALFETRNLST